MTDVSNNNTNSLRQRLDALFEKKLFTNSSVVENFKGKKKKGRGKKKKTKKQKKKQTQPRNIETSNTFLQKEFGFTYVTRKSLTTGKGWRNVFNILFFIIPALIMLVADTIVNIEILKSEKHDPKDDSEYRKYKENDKLWIYNSGIEFFQIFIAAYIASSFYHLIFIERHRDMETYFKGEIDPHFKFDFCSIFLFGLIFLPRLFYFLIYRTVFRPGKDDSGNSYIPAKEPEKNLTVDAHGFLSNVSNFFSTTKQPPVSSGGTSLIENELRSFLPYKDSRTILYLLFYCFSFFICSFLLSKLATLFLDVFIFKANPMMYFFILIAFLHWAIEIVGKLYINLTLNKDGTETIKIPNPNLYFMFSISYVIYLFFHMLFALACAPVAQAIFTIYLLSFMINLKKIFDPEYWGTHATNLYGDIENSAVKIELEKYNEDKPSSTNGFFHKYIFKNNSMMFAFLCMIFFLWKFLTTFIPVWNVSLKIHGLYTSFAVLNFLIAFICFLYYLHVTGFTWGNYFHTPINVVPQPVGNGIGHEGTGPWKFLMGILFEQKEPRVNNGV